VTSTFATRHPPDDPHRHLASEARVVHLRRARSAAGSRRRACEPPRVCDIDRRRLLRRLRYSAGGGAGEGGVVGGGGAAAGDGSGGDSVASRPGRRFLGGDGLRRRRAPIRLRVVHDLRCRRRHGLTATLCTGGRRFPAQVPTCREPQARRASSSTWQAAAPGASSLNHHLKRLGGCGLGNRRLLVVRPLNARTTPATDGDARGRRPRARS
jgi:hypothetical protein